MKRIAAVLLFVLLSVAVGRAKIFTRDELLSLLLKRITPECQRKYDICRLQGNFEQDICSITKNAKQCAFERTLTPEKEVALCSYEVYQKIYGVACMSDEELLRYNSLTKLLSDLPNECRPIVNNCFPAVLDALTLKDICEPLMGGDTCFKGFPGDSKKKCEPFYQHARQTACAGVRGAEYSVALLAGLFLLAVMASLSH